MAGEISSGPSTPESPNSGGFNTDQLPHTTSRSSWNFSYTDDDEAAVDPEIIRDYPDDIPEEEEEGEDLYNENFLDDFRRMGEHDQYESVGLDNSLEDERDMDQIMADLRAAEMELDDRDGPLTSTHSEEDNYRPSKRARADFRPPVVPRSNDDADGMQISPGWSQRDVLTTDHTDEEPYEDEEDEDGEFEMYCVQGTLREWVTRDEVRRFIAKEFKEFLLTYVNPKNE